MVAPTTRLLFYIRVIRAIRVHKHLVDFESDFLRFLAVRQSILKSAPSEFEESIPRTFRYLNALFMLSKTNTYQLFRPHWGTNKYEQNAQIPFSTLDILFIAVADKR